MSRLIRQLKLHSLVGDKVSTDPRILYIETFFAELFDGLHMEVIPVYDKNKVIFHKGRKFYMESDNTFQYLFCSDVNYWFILQTKAELQYVEIQAVTRIMMAKHLNILVKTPIRDRAHTLQWEKKYLTFPR